MSSSFAAVRKCNRNAGFTLVELMFVVALVGVLTAASMSQYRTYVYRSKRSEALYGLRSTHAAQMAHYARNQEYSNSYEELGKPLEAGRITPEGAFEGAIYTFTLDTWALGGKANANYRATATANLDPSDDTMDIIIIENQVTVLD